MSELIDGLLRATLWMSLGVMLLAGARPLLLKLGGPALAYRSWWLLPLLLLAVVMPLPRLSPLDGLALQVLPQLSTKASTAGHAAVDWRAVLIWLWGAGGGFTLARALAVQRRFVRALGTLQRRADGCWQASADPGLPALVGLVCPRVVVGPDFDQVFDAAQRALVLRHEQSHRDHGDPWANAVLLLMRSLFWFHPLTGWAARRFLRDQELACDARVLAVDPAQRRAYAMALIAAQSVHPGLPVACHWRGPSLLKERIAMLKQGKRGWVSMVGGQALLVALCLGAGGMAWASQEDPVAERAEPTATDRDATAIQMTAPLYPQDAFDQNIAGRVDLRVVVGADGRPSDVSIISATAPGVFDEAAVRAAWQWTFTPAQKEGRAVAMALRVPVTFALDNDSGAP